MNATVADPSTGETTEPPRVTVRYWAAAKAAAGRSHDEVQAGTVADALTAALALHEDSPRFAQVLAVCSFLLGETPLGGRDLSAVALEAGDVIEALPPFAGG